MRVLDCDVCNRPVANLSKRRYRKLVTEGKRPVHAACRRLIERRGAIKKPGGARVSETIKVPGVAGMEIVWQTNWQQTKGKPLAKAIVKCDVPRFKKRGVAVIETTDG